jgi:hypothetical protein
VTNNDVERLAAALKDEAAVPWDGNPAEGFREMARHALMQVGLETTDEQFDRAWRTLWQRAFMGGNFTLDAKAMLIAIGST